MFDRYPCRLTRGQDQAGLVAACPTTLPSLSGVAVLLLAVAVAAVVVPSVVAEPYVAAVVVDTAAVVAAAVVVVVGVPARIVTQPPVGRSLHSASVLLHLAFYCKQQHSYAHLSSQSWIVLLTIVKHQRRSTQATL